MAADHRVCSLRTQCTVSQESWESALPVLQDDLGSGDSATLTSVTRNINFIMFSCISALGCLEGCRT